jgi:hypothetical protein
MSTDEEIRAVYDEDIARQTNIVWNKLGKAPFYENFDGFSFENIGDGLGIERIKCSEFTPKVKKWSKKYGKSLGEKS